MEKRKVLLAFDLGTSGVKCSVFDQDACHLASAYEEYETYFPCEGYLEQKPLDWIAAIGRALKKIKGNLNENQLCGIGVSGHSLGVIPVDEKGNLLALSVPIWSDTRAVLEAESFFEKTDRSLWYKKTGNGFPPHLYGLFKVMWYQKNLPEIYEKAFSFIGSKDFINLYLTGKIATDHSYASGSGLYDLKKREYIPEYASLAGVEIQKFPEIYPSHGIIGYVNEKASAEFGIPVGVPVVAGGVDNACMTLGAGCFEEGDSYASLGSSAWVTLCSKDTFTDQKSGIYTFAHCVEGMYIPSVGIFSSGSALDWVSKKFFSSFSSDDRFEKMAKMAKQTKIGAEGLYFIPCLAGGSGADPSPNTKGIFYGFTLAHKKEEVARAAFEGIAMHLFAVSEPFLKDKRLKDSLLLVGGGAKGEFARQVYADVFGLPMRVSSVQQAAASLGAAALAAVGCSLWDSYLPLKKLFANKKEYTPCKENHKIYESIFPIWKKIRKISAEVGDAMKEKR
ncbi:MAG: pentose kinase [Clostridia bacterium]|nr:pentose kinase [Clostridia bacterium]